MCGGGGCGWEQIKRSTIAWVTARATDTGCGRAKMTLSSASVMRGRSWGEEGRGWAAGGAGVVAFLLTYARSSSTAVPRASIQLSIALVHTQLQCYVQQLAGCDT